jgi:hypothetical protein
MTSKSKEMLSGEKYQGEYMVLRRWKEDGG